MKDYRLTDSYLFRDDELKRFSVFSLIDLEICYEYQSTKIFEKDLVNLKNRSWDGIFSFQVDRISSKEEYAELFLWFSRNTKYKPRSWWCSRKDSIDDWESSEKTMVGVDRRVWFNAEDVIARKDLINDRSLHISRWLDFNEYWTGSFRLHVPVKDIINHKFQDKIEELKRELSYKVIWCWGPEKVRYCEKQVELREKHPELRAGFIII